MRRKTIVEPDLLEAYLAGGLQAYYDKKREKGMLKNNLQQLKEYRDDLRGTLDILMTATLATGGIFALSFGIAIMNDESSSIAYKLAVGTGALTCLGLLTFSDVRERYLNIKKGYSVLEEIFTEESGKIRRLIRKI